MTPADLAAITLVQVVHRILFKSNAAIMFLEESLSGLDTGAPEFRTAYVFPVVPLMRPLLPLNSTVVGVIAPRFVHGRGVQPANCLLLSQELLANSTLQWSALFDVVALSHCLLIL